MKDVVGTYISRFKNNKRAQVRLVIILAALAVLVAGVVFWQLHYTGVAMANETYCGYEEHIHDESCYEKVLTCTIEEGAEEESAETTEETKTGHIHDESCYEEILVCGMEEHVHTMDCMVDISADVETAADWEETLPELTGDYAEDVVAIAQSQLGYKESEKNFKYVEETDTKNGYTRYGAWYGNEYGEWNAMFASFCLYYANVPESEFPEGSGVYAWVTALKEKGLYEEDVIPSAGDLAFLDTTGDEEADTIAVVTAVKNDAITVIEGDLEDSVKQLKVELSDESVHGFGILPRQDEQEDETAAAGEKTARKSSKSSEKEESKNTAVTSSENGTYTFEDDNVAVSVILPDETDVPEDAVLSVTALTGEESNYDEMVKSAGKVVTDGTVGDIKFFDIGFNTAKGEYIHVEDTAQVIIEFKDSVLAGKGYTHVLHYNDEGKVSDIAGLSKMCDKRGRVESVSFDTEGFSVFAVADVVPLAETEADLYISYANIDLNYSGTEPFDSDDENGNDMSNDNDIIRSFDRAGYQLTVDIDSSTEQNDVTSVRIHFSINIQGSDIENEYYTQGFSWVTHYEVVENGTSRTMTGYYDYTSDAGVSSSEKSGMDIVVQLLAMSDGIIFQPTGSVWLEEMDDSGNGTNALSEAVELNFPALEVSAALKLNVYLYQGSTSQVSAEGTFNFASSGVDKSYLNYDKGTDIDGRLYAYGIALEMYNTKTGKGMKGQALPDGDTIDLTVKLNSTFTVTDEDKVGSGLQGQTLNLGEYADGNYQMLFYALEGNKSGNSTCADGRSLISTDGYYPAEYYINHIPYNKASSSQLGVTGCENGGDWTAVGQEIEADGTTISIEVSSYEITKLIFPYAYPNNSNATDSYYVKGTAVQDIDCAVFSCGELWMVQPYSYVDDSGTLHELRLEAGQGDFNISVTDGVVDGKVGQYVGASYESYDENIQRDADGNIIVSRGSDGFVDSGKSTTLTVDTQVYSSDDSKSQTQGIIPPGTFNNKIKYISTAKKNGYTNVQGILGDTSGTSYAVVGYDDVSICGGWQFTANTKANIVSASNTLVKFDASALSLKDTSNWLTLLRCDGLSSSLSDYKYFYGYLQSGGNWASDDEMQRADEDELIWYSERQSGKTCVAMLFEYRRPGTITGDTRLRPGMAMNVLNDYNLAGNVYMTCEVTRLWTATDIADTWNESHPDNQITYNDVLSDTDGSNYIYSLIPSAADNYYTEDDGTVVHDTSSLPEQSYGYGSGYDYNTALKGTVYRKMEYAGNGQMSGHNGSDYYGDSLLILSYTTDINMKIAQDAVDQETGDIVTKSIYDFDTVERTADFVVTGSMEIQNSVDTSSWGTTTTTITVTLPEGATYILGSAEYGVADEDGNFTISYTQAETLGQGGTVENGTEFAFTSNIDEYETWLADTSITSGGMLYIYTDENGNQVLTFSVKGVPIQGTEVVKVYFSVELGDEANPKEDLSSGDELTFDATIQTTEDSSREYSFDNKNEASTSIIISRTSSNAFSKYTTQQVTDVGDDIYWVVTWDNTSINNSADLMVLDDMPDTAREMGDYVSVYNGTYEILAFEIDLDYINETDVQDLTFYYTTDKSYEGEALVLEHGDESEEVELEITWDEILEEAAKTDGAWKALSVEIVDGKAIVDLSGIYEYEYDDEGNIISVTNQIYAWAIGGSVPAQEGVHMTLTIRQYGAKGGDYLTNLAYDSTGNSVFHRSCTIYIALRTVSGIIWLDEDMDGGIDTGTYDNEQRIVGATLILEKLGDDGNWYTAEDAYGNYCITTTSEEIIDEDTGEVLVEAGYYEFTELLAGTYRVVLLDGSDMNYKLSEHSLTTTKASGIQTAYNSKAVEASDVTTVNDAQGVIYEIEFPETEIMPVYEYIYDVPYMNAGYTKYVPFTVSKSWQDMLGTDITDSKTAGTISVEIEAVDSNGNTVATRDVVLSSQNDWAETINDLPYYDGNGNAMDYTASGFKVTEVEGDESYVATVSDVTGSSEEGYFVTVVNRAITELPKAGGTGTYLYTIAGVVLVAGAVAGLMYRQKKRKGGKSNC